MKRTDCITDEYAASKEWPQKPCDKCKQLKCDDRPPTFEEYDECVALHGWFPEETASCICDDCFTGKTNHMPYVEWLDSLSPNVRSYYDSESRREEIDAIIKKAMRAADQSATKKGSQ